MLAILIEHAKVDRGLSILHMPMTWYFFMDHDLEKLQTWN
jgi:hypothetical protein